MRRAIAGALCAVALLPFAACSGSKRPPERAPELSVAEQVRKSQSFLRAGRTKEAIDTLREALAAEPTNGALHNYLGIALFGAGRFEEAEPAFARALALDPYLTDARNYLGAVCMELGRRDEAEQHWRKALADPAFPTPQKVLLNLGVLYAGEGRDAEALEHLRRAVEIDPGYHQGHYELAGVLERTGRLDEAAREYEVAAPAYRNDGRYYYRLGLTYFRLGEREKAREKLRRAQSVAPGSPSAAQAEDLLKMLE